MSIISKNIDIVLPLFNPPQQWSEDIVQNFNALVKSFDRNWVFELTIVDDGNLMDLSTGKAIIEREIPGVTWITYSENQGKGFALRKGIQNLTGDITVYTDYDFPYQIENMKDMIKRLNEDEADVLVGVRDENYYRHISFLRNAISKVLKMMNVVFLKLSTADTQCGLKAFNQRGRAIFLETNTNRYLVDVEFLKRLSKTDLSVKTHAVQLRTDVELSEIKNLKLIREMISYIRILLS